MKPHTDSKSEAKKVRGLFKRDFQYEVAGLFEEFEMHNNQDIIDRIERMKKNYEETKDFDYTRG